MRFFSLLLFAMTPMSSGCSTLIGSCGKDLNTVPTMEKVHECFGKPSATEVSDGQLTETYHSHRPIYDEGVCSSYGMCRAMTFGLGELSAFPAAVFDFGRQVIVGQDIRFVYGFDGNVAEISIDGKKHFLHRDADKFGWKPPASP